MDTHEEWRIIKETGGRYSVSNQGRVRSNITHFILKPIEIAKGYVKVNLYLENGQRYSRLVHRLVATEFIPNPENKPEVNHKNGIKHDNRVENLEWVTGEENKRHAYDTGLQRHKDERYSGYLYSVWIRIHRENICKEWKDYLVFHKWSIEQGYREGLFLNRRNTNDLYSPDNCYFGDDKQHPAEKLECFGKHLTYEQISQKYGVSESTLKYRLKSGMSVEDAVMLQKGRAKDNCLRIRFSDPMYNFLFEQAKLNGITVSAYIRKLIDKDIQEKNALKNFKKIKNPEIDPAKD